MCVCAEGVGDHRSGREGSGVRRLESRKVAIENRMEDVPFVESK